MGDEVADTTFSRETRQRYRDKVKLCLDVFARMLAESRFDPDRRSIGLEIELNLTEETGDPAFANHTDGARVDSGGRTWWGNCAWDAFGIVAALGLEDATITAQGITLPRDAAVFGVLVPASHWWDDIAFT